MRRLLANAFVTTVSLSACGKTTPPPEVETHNPPMPTVDTPLEVVDVAAVDAAPAEPKTRVRKRTRPAALAQGAATRPPSPKTLNPKDALGRIVFAGSDDVCFVEVPRKSSEPPPRGVVPPATERVDCPPAMDDPAWDHCTGRLVIDEAAGTCACVNDYGNPPPPPRLAECTTGAVKKKR
jgi:hypothetical protein